jgi:hypothetical protein
VWTDNLGLHRYYEQNGFRHVRTLDLPDYPSGALFQRAATDPRSARDDGHRLNESGAQQLVNRPHEHPATRDDAASYTASAPRPVPLTVLA